MPDKSSCRHEKVTTDGNNTLGPRNLQSPVRLWCRCVQCDRAVQVCVIIDGFAPGQDIGEE